MSKIIVLDTTPLGILTNPHHTAAALASRAWLAVLRAANHRVILPEIADYEVRRELLRAKLSASIKLLDLLIAQLEYLPITTAAMRHAAELWAQARNAGLPTASGAALDGDVILSAQAWTLGSAAIVATGNPAHLSRFVAAQDWQAIVP